MAEICYREYPVRLLCKSIIWPERVLWLLFGDGIVQFFAGYLLKLIPFRKAILTDVLGRAIFYWIRAIPKVWLILKGVIGLYSIPIHVTDLFRGKRVFEPVCEIKGAITPQGIIFTKLNVLMIGKESLFDLAVIQQKFITR